MLARWRELILKVFSVCCHQHGEELYHAANSDTSLKYSCTDNDNVRAGMRKKTTGEMRRDLNSGKISESMNNLGLCEVTLPLVENWTFPPYLRDETAVFWSCTFSFCQEAYACKCWHGCQMAVQCMSVDPLLISEECMPLKRVHAIQKSACPSEECILFRRVHALQKSAYPSSSQVRILTICMRPSRRNLWERTAIMCLQKQGLS